MDWKSILANILQFGSGLLSSNKTPEIKINIPLGTNSNIPDKPAIDWLSPDGHVTENFTVNDACCLHSWNRLAGETDGFNDAMKQKLIKTCQMMEKVRTFLGCPINVHCMYRSEQYNTEIVHEIPNDVHAQGQACDFDCLPKLTCDEVKQKLLPQLKLLGIRMENNGKGANWVHVDWHPVGNSRYFLP